MVFYTIIFAPLIGATSGLFGRYIGSKGSVFITTLSVFTSFMMSLTAFYQIILLDNQFYLNLGPWIHSGSFQCNWGFMFDTLTVSMLLVVTSISTLVHLYSSEYMAHDPHLSRFMSYLSFFTFFMVMLVTADNFISMFLGWEGVGLCSYLLINFWYTRLQANKAAIKAMIVNRISDFILILGILMIFTNFKSVDYASVFAMSSVMEPFHFYTFDFNPKMLDIICLFILLGAMGKSAQIFLHVWLPDAMEGPTPVSALIHAATMVTAGVFLIIRCSHLFEYSPLVLKITTVVGALTAFFAGSVGLAQNDLKKVIAYSTCSQLGYMVFACGVSNYQLSIFHLSNHAFFKALLFLSAGSVIHGMSDEQDMRKMGGLRRVLPYTYIMFVIGSLSLMGFPFLTGFYSKDAILEASYATHTTIGHFAYWLGTIAAFCTAFYSTRLIYLTFLAKTNSYKKVILNAHDAPFRMAFPLALLAFGSIFIGYLSRDMFIGLGTDYWQNAIYVHASNVNLIDAEFLPTIMKLLPVIFSMTGMFSAFYLYHFSSKFFFEKKMSKEGRLIYNFLNKKWYFDKIYNEYIVQNLLHFGYHITYKLIDKGIVELFGPYGITKTLHSLSKRLSSLQTGYIYNYSFVMLFSLIFFGLLLLNNIFEYNNQIAILLVLNFLIIFLQNFLKK